MKAYIVGSCHIWDNASGLPAIAFPALDIRAQVDVAATACAVYHSVHLHLLCDMDANVAETYWPGLTDRKAL